MRVRAFQEAYVVSDLHIGGKSGFQMFAASKQFETLISTVCNRIETLRRDGDQNSEVLLVINGDFIDFLAEMLPEDEVGRHKRYFAMDDADQIVQRILNHSEFRSVTKALQKFVAKAGANLVVVLGNHDLELALPDAREAFLEIVTSGDNRRRSRVELAFEGWGYRFSVGGVIALCLHGNETDSFNFTRYDELDRIQGDLRFLGRSDFGQKWVPSAGTKLVIDAVNPLKKDYPFVDLLHPLLPLVPAVLGLLDIRTTKYVDEAVAMAASSVRNEMDRPGSQRRMLSSQRMPGTAPTHRHEAGVTADSIADDIERAMEDGTIDDLIAGGSAWGSRMLGISEWFSRVKDAARRAGEQIVELKDRTIRYVDESWRTTHCAMMRELLARIVPERMDSPLELSDEDKAVERTIVHAYDIVFAGHTHHQRITARDGDRHGWYVNTGCWADRMTLLQKDVADSHRFRTIYDAMISGDRNRLRNPALELVRQECPVARVQVVSAGVELALGQVLSSSQGNAEVVFQGGAFSKILQRA